MIFFKQLLLMSMCIPPLQELVRGGIEVSASLNYEFTAGVTGRYKLYNGPFQFCLTLRHGWPNSNVKISLYKQTRKIKFCKKWRWIHYVSLPCYMYMHNPLKRAYSSSMYVGLVCTILALLKSMNFCTCFF